MDRTEAALVVALLTVVALGGLVMGRAVYGTTAPTTQTQTQIVVLAKNQAFTTNANGKASLNVNIPSTNFQDNLGVLAGNMATGTADATQVTVEITATLTGSYCSSSPSSCVVVPLGGGNGQTSTVTGSGNTVQFQGMLPTIMNMVTVHVSVNCATTTCANVAMSFTLVLAGRGS